MFLQGQRLELFQLIEDFIQVGLINWDLLKQQSDKKMETIIILTLVIVVGWILFRPIKKKELDRYNDKDNWSNMGF